MNRVVDPDTFVTPGFVLVVGQVLSYLLTMAYLNTSIGPGVPYIFLKSWSFLIVFILAVVSGMAFEMLAYKRFISRPAVEELRVAASPWWHFIIAALIGLSFGVAMAGLLNWWHRQP